MRRGMAMAGLALLLSLVAGFVDTVGYLALSHVFTANMTGNTVALGAGLVDGELAAALRRGFAIPMFVLGLLLSRLVVNTAHRLCRWRVAACLFGAEALALTAFVALGKGWTRAGEVAGASTGRFYLLVALPALAMGLQNATLTHFGPLTVRTTHVTGTLAELADCVAILLLDILGRARLAQRHLTSPRRPPSRKAALLASVFLFYFLGIVLGALLNRRWELLSLVLPIGCLVLVAAVDLIHPLRPPDPESSRKQA